MYDFNVENVITRYTWNFYNSSILFSWFLDLKRPQIFETSQDIDVTVKPQEVCQINISNIDLWFALYFKKVE